MKVAVMVCSMVLLYGNGAANACSIVNEEKVQIGNSQGVKGTCSNNGLPISCVFSEGEGIACDGPGGRSSGDNQSSLVFSACGCSAQEEKERKQKKDLESGK
jgi:hypothetical protein